MLLLELIQALEENKTPAITQKCKIQLVKQFRVQFHVKKKITTVTCILRCSSCDVIFKPSYQNLSAWVIYSTLTLSLAFPEVQLDCVIYSCPKSKFNTAKLDYLWVLHTGQESLNTSRPLHENRKCSFIASVFFTRPCSLLYICVMFSF